MVYFLSCKQFLRATTWQPVFIFTTCQTYQFTYIVLVWQIASFGCGSLIYQCDDTKYVSCCGAYQSLTFPSSAQKIQNNSKQLAHQLLSISTLL